MVVQWELMVVSTVVVPTHVIAKTTAAGRNVNSKTHPKDASSIPTENGFTTKKIDIGGPI